MTGEMLAKKKEMRSVTLQKEITKRAWAIPYESIVLEEAVAAGGSATVYKGRFGTALVAVKLMFSVMMECEDLEDLEVRLDV